MRAEAAPGRRLRCALSRRRSSARGDADLDPDPPPVPSTWPPLTRPVGCDNGNESDKAASREGAPLRGQSCAPSASSFPLASHHTFVKQTLQRSGSGRTWVLAAWAARSGQFLRMRTSTRQSPRAPALPGR